MVITDLQMKTMSGLDLVRSVRAIRADTPFAVASGYAADKTNDADAATVVWIHKPSTLTELAAAVHRTLKGKVAASEG